MNRLVRGNLVRGLPSKLFENDHTCVACQKGKQHKASCKTKLVSSISQPLQMLHMDLFGPTFIKSLNKKMYCLVVTDDFSRCENGTEFKNSEMNQFCAMLQTSRVASRAVDHPVALQENGTLVTKMYVPITAEEKTNKKNDVKVRSLLLMALPNEHQLTFSQYTDAKTMFAAIKTRFGFRHSY
ncbi:putative ribonuclease H-like domain-containing protein [Tanacetum coccineum]